jgi:hypothetical protein
MAAVCYDAITAVATVVYTGSITWSGSGASLATTVTGVAATDIILTQFTTSPTQAAYITKAVPTANTITITLSTANTGNDAVIKYVVIRPA